MNKPLTLEQLKQLRPYDWIWLVADREQRYVQIISVYADCMDFERFVIPDNWYSSIRCLWYKDYGTKWIAYKNLEQVSYECDTANLNRKELQEQLLKQYQENTSGE